MKYKPPEKLNSRTPQWFREWHDNAFWHFKFAVEDKVERHDKILWILLGVAVATLLVGIY